MSAERRTQSADRSQVPRRSLCALRSAPCAVHSRAYTLVEFFVTIAVLIIVLGLMVDLANRVRRNSADHLTRQLLQRLAALMENYKQHNGGQLPPITPFYASGQVPEEPGLQAAARVNNADFVRLLRGQSDLTHPPTTNPLTAREMLRPPPQDVFAGLPLSLYDEVTLHDPWGSPIVFMPHQHPLIGMAAGDNFFFFSAGADGKFLTREDNLYSYEEGSSAP
jgi:type II secretory pathway pseudopilin PulG